MNTPRVQPDAVATMCQKLKAFSQAAIIASIVVDTYRIHWPLKIHVYSYMFEWSGAVCSGLNKSIQTTEQLLVDLVLHVKSLVS